MSRAIVASRPSRFAPLLWPGLMTVAMLAVLIALGIWQVQRLAWKTALLDRIDRAEAAQAVPLPVDPAPFAKVRVRGRWRGDLSALYGASVRDTPEGPQMGADLLVPLELPDGVPVLVDRGWVPQARPQPLAPSPVSSDEGPVEGYVRPAETPGPFSAGDDPVARRFFTLNPAAIGAALGLAHLAPFTLVALGDPPPDRYPDPARHLPRPPNDHLSYAITWFSLAAALAVVFAVWASKVIRA